MQAHRLARPGAIALCYLGGNRLMFPLEGFEVGALAFRAMRGDPDALPRDNEAPKIFKDMGELRIAGRRCDGAMKGEILVDRTFATIHRGIDRRERLADPTSSSRGAALGR